MKTVKSPKEKTNSTPSPSKKQSKSPKTGTILKISLQNIWRNKVLSLATIFVMAIILFIFNIILSINFLAEKGLATLSEKIDLVVYLKESAPESDIQKLIKNLGTLKEISQIEYTTKEKALKDLKETHPDLSLAFEKYGLSNPLPKSLSITTKNPQDHEKVLSYLADDKFSNILASTNQKSEDLNTLNSISKNLNHLSIFARQILFWIILTFIIGGALIMINALQITIFSRKSEIEVMKIIGASHSFIRMPFIIEAAIYGTLSVLFCFLMLFILSLNPAIKEIGLIHTNIYTLLGAQLLGTLFLSMVSASLAVREHI
ncbi:MAG: permease-like cell division protein FtsX [Candidatus Gracilibacteria bacterium]|jgi:cell division transport system permease protein|nr:permease-like cell division protein FtsX [Candidatus Gracilibacteria bacterium]